MARVLHMLVLFVSISTALAIQCHQCFYPYKIKTFLDAAGSSNSNCFVNPVGVAPTNCPDSAKFCMILQLNMSGTAGVMRKCMNPSELGYEDPAGTNTCIEVLPTKSVHCIGRITDYKACFCRTEDGCNRDSVAVGGGGRGGCDGNGESGGSSTETAGVLAKVLISAQVVLVLALANLRRSL